MSKNKENTTSGSFSKTSNGIKTETAPVLNSQHIKDREFTKDSKKEEILNTTPYSKADFSEVFNRNSKGHSGALGKENPKS